MEIPPHLRPPDTAARKRAADTQAAAPESGSRTPLRNDAVESSPDREAIARYSALAKNLATDPTRLNQLREELANGVFTATPEELAQRLLDDGPA